MRGYWAQVWRSVLIWLDLGESERLYLEGAEDIDRVSGINAETIQVKDTAANVTLRSPAVIEAIDHAWIHAQKNPRYAIKLRFLTSAGIGVEQGGAFPSGSGGLSYWNDLRTIADEAARNDGARAIAQFLLRDAKISAELQAFLQTAQDSEVWQRMIAPVEWDTDADGLTEVRREVGDRLILLGETYGVTPDAAAAVADHLYTYAFETSVRQKDRVLSRPLLLQLFEARTRISLPAEVANALGLGPIALAMCGACSPADQRRIDRVLADRDLFGFAPAFLRSAGLEWAADLLAQFPSHQDVSQ
jgi:hypothetical protein